MLQVLELAAGVAITPVLAASAVVLAWCSCVCGPAVVVWVLQLHFLTSQANFWAMVCWFFGGCCRCCLGCCGGFVCRCLRRGQVGGLGRVTVGGCMCFCGFSVLCNFFFHVFVVLGCMGMLAGTGAGKLADRGMCPYPNGVGACR